MHGVNQEFRQEVSGKRRGMKIQDLIIVSWKHSIGRSTHDVTPEKIWHLDNLRHRPGEALKIFEIVLHRSQPHVGEDRQKHSSHEDMAPQGLFTQIRIVGGGCRVPYAHTAVPIALLYEIDQQRLHETRSSVHYPGSQFNTQSGPYSAKTALYMAASLTEGAFRAILREADAKELNSRRPGKAREAANLRKWSSNPANIPTFAKWVPKPFKKIYSDSSM